MQDARAYERALRPLLSQGAGYARSLLGNRADAEDAVQQAALRAWERIESYDQSRPFKGWWFAILRNCSFDILRQRGKFRAETLDGFDLPETTVAETFDSQSLDAGLRRLSDAHNEILRLKYYGGLSYNELAEALEIPKGTVMSRLHLARKALSEQLREETT